MYSSSSFQHTTSKKNINTYKNTHTHASGCDIFNFWNMESIINMKGEGDVLKQPINLRLSGGVWENARSLREREVSINHYFRRWWNNSLDIVFIWSSLYYHTALIRILHITAPWWDIFSKMKKWKVFKDVNKNTKLHTTQTKNNQHKKGGGGGGWQRF